MAKRTVEQVEFQGQRVLMRADFNVPLDGERNITDDRRIRGALPTIQRILAGGGRLMLMSHLGRPDGKPDAKYSLAPVARRLGELLGQDVPLAPDCIGGDVAKMAETLAPGGCMVLENLRFHAAETIKDKKAKDDPALRAAKDTFAQALADMADVYVNDAFGTCHRDNASMLTVPQRMGG
jgi:phosphoglycerate kinase